jgi:hypothetical protein
MFLVLNRSWRQKDRIKAQPELTAIIVDSLCLKYDEKNVRLWKWLNGRWECGSVVLYGGQRSGRDYCLPPNPARFIREEAADCYPLSSAFTIALALEKSIWPG